MKIFFKAADKRTTDKKEATTDKSFQSLVCGMDNGIKQQGKCLYKYILGLFKQKTNRKRLYSLIFQNHLIKRNDEPK